MSRPGRAKINIPRGDDYELELEFQVDGVVESQAGATWLAQIREGPTSAAVLTTFAVDTTNATTGIIVLTLTAAQTTALPLKDLVADVQRTLGGKVRTMVSLDIEVHPDVSR